MTHDAANLEARRRYGLTGFVHELRDGPAGEARKCVGLVLPWTEQAIICGSAPVDAEWEAAFADADRNGLATRADAQRFLEEVVAHRRAGGTGLPRKTSLFWIDLAEWPAAREWARTFRELAGSAGP